MADAGGGRRRRPPRCVEADIGFHEYILSCSGQPHTSQVWRSIAPRIRAYFFRFGRESDLARIAVEHGQLLEALRSRDSELLSEALERHIAIRTAARHPLEEFAP